MQLNKQQLEAIEKSLDKCKSVQDAFDLLSKTFDLKNTSIEGFLIGKQFREGMIKAIKFLNPPLK
jgi:hypothetical protein